MKLLRGLNSIPDFSEGTAITYGSFDSLHKGHQALLAQLRAQADKLGLPMVVLLLESPRKHLSNAENTPQLSSLRGKMLVLKDAGVDYVYFLQLWKFFPLPAQKVTDEYLFSLLRAKYILVGEDFHFDYDGDMQLMKEEGKKANCVVETFPDFYLNNKRVDTDEIRGLLSHGEVEKASVLLGRYYSLCGRVIHGDQLGRQWGIPTANLDVSQLALPLKGIFCVKIQRQNGEWLEGVASLGKRPTVGGTKNVLEVNIFDFSGDLYGELLEVLFLHKLRDELKFNSVDELIAKIHEDIVQAKAYH